jgi:uncharacterized protein
MDVQTIKQKVIPILKRRAVTRAGVFGSSVRKGEIPRDIDMLVEMPRPYGLFTFLALKDELESTLGIKVDLIEYSNIKSRIKDRILKEEITIL